MNCRNLVRSGLLGLGALALLSLATPASAYDEDTHFLMTYVVCRASGFTHQEALTVAAVDQGMDVSPGTVANGGGNKSETTANVLEEWLWHAEDKDGQMGPKGVLARKDYLFQVALSRSTPQEKLKYLGVFFHYQQDTSAHRHHYDGDPHSKDAFTTYNTPLGHGLYGHQPDRPPFDPVAAFLCLEDSCEMARTFLEKGLGRQPTALFAGYQPFGGAFQDNSWSDGRNGKFFHQLGYRADATPAQAFLCKLIQAQINAYSTSLDANPNYTGRYTSDELDFEKARSALQGVCDAEATALGFKMTLPSKPDKLNQGFTTLTTAGLSAAVPR